MPSVTHTLSVAPIGGQPAQPDIRMLTPLLGAVPNEGAAQCIPAGTARPMLAPLVSNALNELRERGAK